VKAYSLFTYYLIKLLLKERGRWERCQVIMGFRCWAAHVLQW